MQPPDSEIDFSDAPEATPAQLARGLADRRARMGRPPRPIEEQRTAVSIRFEPALLKRLKAVADRQHVPYQTLLQTVVSRYLQRQR